MSEKPDKVELKSTVEPADVASALARLGLRLHDPEAELTLIHFCDAPGSGKRLVLEKHGLIVRLRRRLALPDGRRPTKADDVTVKLRPAPADLSALRRTRCNDEDDKFEGDWTSTKKEGRTNSYSRKVDDVARSAIARASQHVLAVQDAISRGQRALIETVLGDDLPAGLRCFAPVIATTWQLDDGRAAELWTLGATRFLEISERADRDAAAEKLAQQRTYLRDLGVRVGTAGPKTQRILGLACRVGTSR